MGESRQVVVLVPPLFQEPEGVEDLLRVCLCVRTACAHYGVAL